MLKINKGEPWVMWPNNLVSNYIDVLGNKIFDEKKNYTFKMIFELTEPVDEKQTLFAKLPSYFGIDLSPEGCLLIYKFEDSIETYYLFEKFVWELNKKYELIIQKNESELTITINGESIFEIDLMYDLSANDNSHIIFGSGNFPSNGYNLNYCTYNFHYLSMTINDKLISEHNFQTLIHDKWVDESNNCNFIHKVV